MGQPEEGAAPAPTDRGLSWARSFGHTHTRPRLEGARSIMSQKSMLHESERGR
jgi:hypothetical protein